jgi:predicted ester cyclase
VEVAFHGAWGDEELRCDLAVRVTVSRRAGDLGLLRRELARAREFVDRVFNGQDGERAREFFTPDITLHALTVGTVTGVDEVVPILAGFVGALSDIHAEVQDVIASNDLVALRQVVKARHTGNLLGIPATGDPVQWDAVDIYRINDTGKISEQWAFEDFAAILSQVGGVKLPWAW